MIVVQGSFILSPFSLLSIALLVLLSGRILTSSVFEAQNFILQPHLFIFFLYKGPFRLAFLASEHVDTRQKPFNHGYHCLVVLSKTGYFDIDSGALYPPEELI